MKHDESAQEIFYFDPRTGLPTAINGAEISPAQRAACSSFNRQRARGIIQVREAAQRREQIPADVWRQSFTGRLNDWEVPIVSLEDLGIRVEDGSFESDSMFKLRAGAEASPFLDEENGVVYKLFDLRANGSLGKKLKLQRLPDELRYNLVNDDADVIHTVQKLSALHEAGGLPTEIVGYADSGDILIVKQPQAQAHHHFRDDLRTASDSLHAIFPGRANFGRSCGIFFALGDPWLVADLHEGNIMRDSESNPVVIDALIGEIPPNLRKQLPWLEEACNDAQEFRETGIKPTRDLFDGVSDDDL
ncbi:hypothetical protein [Roseibacillus persicicus]|uniref:hypothetical protein n=1 Tax=Roseibacillus persicicus TaxID=454148 RepID=UPI00280E86D9|nr:hypothetical protein [Roseibacillus persicicus]MDQ8192214.1 hypothetical protein [Roseibacillus persicicus]